MKRTNKNKYLFINIICLLILFFVIIVTIYSNKNYKQSNINENFNNIKYKCIIFTPAGRKQYLEILVKYLEKQKNDFNEWHLWLNTLNVDDILYIKNLANNYSWIKVIEHPNSDPSLEWKNIHKFFDYTRDPSTIYIRLDDDIVYLEPTFIKKLYNARLQYDDKYFFVYANIINNAIITHLHQRTGVFNYNKEIIEYDCMGNGWKNPEICYELHKQFISSIINKKNEDWYDFKSWIALNNERISINALAFYGKDFINIDVDEDEEQFLSSDYPKYANLKNIIIGNILCVHYAFGSQREFLDTTNILELYKNISNDI